MRASAFTPRRQLLWLGLAALLFIASGFGLRDPWPADEPRFALIARDMVLTGDWLFPRVGGELYSDKPPVYFWLLAALYWLTGSIRFSFLIPSIVAALGTLALVYDMARRLHGQAAALAAAATLLCTLQFVATFRGAQIDPTLCLLVTLSCYGMLRHLLLGPAWGWYLLAGIAAGLGIITKGVGFLPLLLLPAWAALRRLRFAGLPAFDGGWRWLLVVPAMMLGVAPWLVPMLAGVARDGGAEFIEYRNDILFGQTVTRYAAAWHHHKPWYYFLVQVVPGLWLPWSLLLFWLVPEWARAWRAREARQWLPVAWVLLVLLFFSISAGKRGVYLLPALPMLALAAAPSLPHLYARAGVRRASLGLGVAIFVIAACAAAVLALDVRDIAGAARRGGLTSFWPVYAMALLTAGALLLVRRRAPLLAWPATLLAVALCWAYGGMPQLNEQRSGRTFVHSILASQPRDRTLAMVGYKEQFLLYLPHPVLNFGHRRSREGQQENYDAAAWLNAAPRRVLLVPEANMQPCFTASPQTETGKGRGERWFYVSAPAAADCARRGDAARPLLYPPPGARFIPE